MVTPWPLSPYNWCADTDKLSKLSWPSVAIQFSTFGLFYKAWPSVRALPTWDIPKLYLYYNTLVFCTRQLHIALYPIKSSASTSLCLILEKNLNASKLHAG